MEMCEYVPDPHQIAEECARIRSENLAGRAKEVAMSYGDDYEPRVYHVCMSRFSFQRFQQI